MTSLYQLAMYFLRLGATGFGGPAVLVARMHRDLVEDRKWFGEETYRDGVALAQLAPGPLAAQVAIYFGWAQAGIRGATIIGLAFIAPSLIMVLALSSLYVRFGGMPWIGRAFYGIGAAVIAIVLRSVIRLSSRTLSRDSLLWIVFAVNAIATAVTARELLSVIVVSSAVVMLLRWWPRARTQTPRVPAVAFPLLLLTGVTMGGSATLTLFLFFAKASMVVFGSGLAVLPFIYGGVVTGHHWLTSQQFLDAVAVSMITPGPVVITVAFIGFIVGGTGGALSAAAGMFIPTYAAVVLLAPVFVRVRHIAAIRWFVEGITAAATGALAGSVIILGEHALTDVTAVLIAIAAMMALMVWKNVPEPVVILCAGVAGLLLR